MVKELSYGYLIGFLGILLQLIPLWKNRQSNKEESLHEENFLSYYLNSANGTFTMKQICNVDHRFTEKPVPVFVPVILVFGILLKPYGVISLGWLPGKTGAKKFAERNWKFYLYN